MKLLVPLLFLLSAAILPGCMPADEKAIVNRHAEAYLTNQNELQFRFKLNSQILSGEELFKVKVLIHNQRLAKALGTKEIIYGADSVYDGQYMEAEENGGEKMVYMDPIPLQQDLLSSDIEQMISSDQAVSVEVYNDQKVIAEAYLTNFSTQF
ncbi:hypothetical protein [Bacillus infantis]|uniref:hypothetical protein n=1 Tax=Bacillus infantis TaxID=324767 RepID=UPI0021557056|nr:hypothetical protein [Bacillus infantis]MCR6610253.1 hypothetical protein [Bacillus infantis]